LRDTVGLNNPRPAKDLRPRDFVRFRRHRFVAKFPRAYRYSPAHFWLCEDEGVQHIGLTHFATRMLGEIVEFDFETSLGNEVEDGQVIGWIEGMKAVTDLFCVAGGSFAGANSTALGDPELVCKDPYGSGWLYAVHGQPGAGTLDLDQYLAMLGETIDAMEEQPWKTPQMAT